MKPSRIRKSFAALTAFALMHPSSSQAASQTWDNGAADMIWSRTSANWGGAAYTVFDDVVFDSVGVGTITVDNQYWANMYVGTYGNPPETLMTFNTAGYNIKNDDITGGGIWFQNAGTIQMNADAEIDSALGGGWPADITIAGPGTLTLNPSKPSTLYGLNVTGNVSLNGGTLATSAGGSSPTWGMYLNGGNLTVAGGTLNTAGWDTFVSGTFTISSGAYNNIGDLSNATNGNATINVSGGNFSVAGSIWVSTSGNNNGTINLNGGTLDCAGTGWDQGVHLTPWAGAVQSSTGTLNLDSGNLITSFIYNGSGTGTVNFNGGTVTATQDNANQFISWQFSAPTCNVKSGGAIFDTAGHNIGILAALVADSPSGGLTKNGLGTLTLYGTNTYTGDTKVSGGVLAVNGSCIADTNKLIIAGGKVDLTNAETVNSLFFGTTQQAAGTYSATGDGGTILSTNFTGSGTLIVTTGAAADPYSIWADTFLPGNDVSNPAGDNDHDGLTNQQEFAFGLSPVSSSSVNPITVQLDKTTGTFTYQRRAATGLTYKIQTSTDLVDWPEDTGATASQVAGAVTDGNQTVVVTLTGTKPLATAQLFVRVAAQQ